MPSTPIMNQQDVIVVKNIDLNCGKITQDTVFRQIEFIDAEGKRRTKEVTDMRSFSHDKFYQVRYNGQPWRIEPGKTKDMIRYVGEHWANALCDHLLIMQEDAENKRRRKEEGFVQYVNNDLMRREILNKVILGVRFFYAPEPEVSGADDELDVEESNSNRLYEESMGDHAVDLGTYRSKVEGVSNAMTPFDSAMPSEPIDLENTVPVVETDLDEPTTQVKKERTRKELQDECVTLGIPITGKENKPELQEKIDQFAGV